MYESIYWPIAGFLLLSYAAYCWQKEGTHVKGKGWMSKEDAPKSYLFNQWIYFLLGLSMVASPIIWMLMK